MVGFITVSGRCSGLGRGARVVGLAALVALVLAVWLGILTSSAGAVSAVPPRDPGPVADKIMCQCGCGAVLSNCPHTECGWGIPEKEFIGQELEAGRSADELIDYYVSRYGEKVLASPSKSGFNLTAWVTPFAVLITAGVAVFFLIQIWTRDRRLAEEQLAPVLPELPEDKSRRLEEELKDFD